MTKIIVTGAAGFLGGRVATYLAASMPGANIIATSRRSSGAEELEKKGCTFIPGDLADREFCERLTGGATIIVHCAALSSPYGSYKAFYSSNYLASKNLLEASVKNSVEKFIFISTPSIYHSFSDRFNVKESDPLPRKMVNNYALTKLMAEEMILGMNGKGIETIALRPRAIIGAGDTVIFPRIVEASASGKLRIIGRGDNICHLTCARNVIEAIMCCINAGKQAYGQAYNISDGEPVKLWDALNYALEALGMEPCIKKVPTWMAMTAARVAEIKALARGGEREPAMTRYSVAVLGHSLTLDISRAREILNYKPVMTSREGINEFIEWHRGIRHD